MQRVTIAVAGLALLAPALVRAEPGVEAAISGCAVRDANAETTACLMERARAGDRAALLQLAEEADAGGPDAPRVADIIAAETVLAERGDPVMAWRLARRYETGDGVPPSAEQMIFWLRKTAGADAAHPNAREAAFRLCGVYGRGEGVPRDEAEARAWCQRAADAGHPGAAIVLARLNSGA